MTDLTRVSTAMIAGLPLISGGATQSLESILLERVSVKRFGAVGDGTHDDTAAIQAAITWAIAHSARLHIPAGVYKTTSGLVADLTANTADRSNRLCIEGDGPANSIIAPTSALGAGTALKIIGGASGSGMQAWSEIGGFGIECSGGTAVAIAMENFAFFKMHSVRIIGANYGLYLRDVLSGVFEKINIRFCLRGIYGDRNGDGGSDGYRSGPNNLNFIGCTVGLCAEWGVTFLQGAACNWFGGSVEHCGRGGSGDTRYGVLISNAGLEGGSGGTWRGVYFEGNVGYADIWISQGENQCAYLIDGNTFNRIHTPVYPYLTAEGVPTETNTGIPNPNYQQYTASNIRVETNSRPVSVVITGNGFRSLQAVSGAPYVDHPSRPCIAQSTSPLVQVVQHGNLFDSSVASPYGRTPRTFRAAMTSGQSMPNATATKVAFASGEINDNLWFDTSGQVFHAYARCRMHFTAQLWFADVPDGGDCSVTLVRNNAAGGTTTVASSGIFSRGAGTCVTVSTIVNMEEGDTMEVRGYQNSAGTRNVYGDPHLSYFIGTPV